MKKPAKRRSVKASKSAKSRKAVTRRRVSRPARPRTLSGDQAIVAILIAWFLVNILFSVLAFVFKLAVVAVVAVIVFFILRAVFSRDGSERP